MSSRRLLLVSGAPGVGTSTVAQALAHAAGIRGEHAQVIPYLAIAPAPEFTALLGSWDPLLGEAIAGLPALRTAQGLLAATRATAEGLEGSEGSEGSANTVDTVVWDAGPIEALLADLAALDALDLAAGRVSGSVVAIAASLAGDRLVAARRVQAAVAQALGQARAEHAAMVLVDEPTAGLRARIRSTRAAAALLGLSIDHLAINRVPRRRDDWPTRWASDRRRRAARASDLGIPASSIPWIIDDADEAVVVRRIAKRLADVPVRRSGGEGVLHRDSLVVEERDGGYALRIPMPHADPDSVRVGRLGDVLVLEVAGLRRLLALPPVLIRCIVDGGGIVGDDLVLRFTPDPAQWRSAS